MKNQLILSALVALGTPVLMAQGYFDDDIYYDPKKDQTTSFQKKKKKSNYIANMADMDVDTYNRRGEQYYATPIDTIGAYAENGEDFVYTQQIQKYYNPTIVVDNADVLGDLLANSYGNVEIVIDNNGLPIFSPYTYSPWSYRYYPGWGFNAGPWGWSVGFYDPWYSWNWGWNWGPSWAWGPSWGGPVGGGRPPMADWRPSGNRPSAPRPGWSSTTRPGGNLAHRQPSRPSTSGRPSSGSRPGNMSQGGSIPRPGGSTGVVNNNGRWEYNTSGTTGHRKAGTGVINTGRGNDNRNTGTRVDRNTNTNTNHRSYNTNRNTNTNTNRNTNYNNNRGSYNTGRGTGGFGGGRSTGGRSTGGRSTGGGSRGHR